MLMMITKIGKYIIFFIGLSPSLFLTSLLLLTLLQYRPRESQQKWEILQKQEAGNSQGVKSLFMYKVWFGCTCSSFGCPLMTLLLFNCISSSSDSEQTCFPVEWMQPKGRCFWPRMSIIMKSKSVLSSKSILSRDLLIDWLFHLLSLIAKNGLSHSHNTSKMSRTPFQTEEESTQTKEERGRKTKERTSTGQREHRRCSHVTQKAVRHPFILLSTSLPFSLFLSHEDQEDSSGAESQRERAIERKRTVHFSSPASSFSTTSFWKTVAVKEGEWVREGLLFPGTTSEHFQVRGLGSPTVIVGH